MRTLLAALTALMLFATPVVAGDLEDAVAAWFAGDYAYAKALPLYTKLAAQGYPWAQYQLAIMYDLGQRGA